MSYDLLVFEVNGVPRHKADFADWLMARREAVEEIDVPLLAPATERLGAFYDEMVTIFPDLNGHSGKDMSDLDILAGYEFQSDHIYMDFRWSLASEARALVIDLAEEHGLGFYDLVNLLIFPRHKASAQGESADARATPGSEKPSLSPLPAPPASPSSFMARVRNLISPKAPN